MSNYRMDIKGDISSKEYSNIYDYLSIVDVNDKFTIIFEKDNNSNIKMVNSMLIDNSFEVKNQGYDSKGAYYINAAKNG